MKKLLVLALVLSMATLANAALLTSDGTATNGLTLAVSPAGAVTVTGPTTTDFALVVVSDGTLSPTDNTALTANAPSMSGLFVDFATLIGGVTLPSDYISGGAWNIASAPQENYKTGAYMSFTMTGGTGVTIAALNGETYALEQVLTVAIPEPMTIGLLGLGGLFLRRRK